MPTDDERAEVARRLADLIRRGRTKKALAGQIGVNAGTFKRLLDGQETWPSRFAMAKQFLAAHEGEAASPLGQVTDEELLAEVRRRMSLGRSGLTIEEHFDDPDEQTVVIHDTDPERANRRSTQHPGRPNGR